MGTHRAAPALRRRRWGRRLFAALATLALAGCLESDEERAARAYDRLDFDTARTLATGIAEEGNPRGHELLALMAAQGLGQPVDYAAALAAADRAAALDSGYGTVRATVLDRIAADRAAAERAFADGRYERALRFAAPLAAFGDEAAKRLETALITGHYVALPGSDMPWRAFWEECSGNVRFEDDRIAQERFDADCMGRAAVWDGTVIRLQGDVAYVKMRPGRPGARPDLALELAGEEGRDMLRPGAKLRFAGHVAGRGTPNRPDRLTMARATGPAPPTADEAAREETRRRQSVAGACQRLVEGAWRAGRMPAWAVETEREVVAGGSPRSRAFALLVGVAGGLDAFQPTPQGGWRGVFDGTVTIQSSVARTAEAVDFTAECTLGPEWRRGGDPARHGALRFLALSGPRVDSAPGRLRRGNRP